MSPANIEIDMVRKYSGYARGICTALLVLMAAVISLYLLKKFPDAPTSGARFWMVTSVAGSVLAGAVVYLLRRLFHNLAGGEIFSSRNVEHIRHIAFIFCGAGMFKLLVLITYGILVTNGVIEDSQPRLGAREPEDEFLGGMFNSFMMAGILWLASWIMHVGLGVRNEADELKREAELVV
jgi:hypothetical protein